MVNLNFILEEAVGSVLVLAVCLLGCLTFYICDWLHYKKTHIWSALFVGVPPAMALAMILWLVKIGILLTWGTMWWGRFLTPLDDRTAFTRTQTGFVVTGSVIVAVGFLLMIRLISRPRAGHLPWLASAGAAITYLAANFIIRNMV